MGWTAYYLDPDNFFPLLDGNEGKGRQGGENAFVHASLESTACPPTNMNNTPERWRSSAR